MKVVFMGTPDFAVPTLEKLITEHEVVCVYTRAPKPAGRGKQLSPTPVHLLAKKHGIEVRTPKTLRTEAEQAAFRALKADLAVVAAYGLILPQEVIEAFPLGCINVHASLLPRWRGAAPIQRAVEAGDHESGVSIMRVMEALDAGAVYEKAVVPIDSHTTGGILHDELARVGAETLSHVLKNFANLTLQPQDESLVTYAAKLDKAEAKLNFNQSAEVLERKIRAFNPFPGAYFEYEGERFKVLRAEVADNTAKEGLIIEEKENLMIACADQSLRVLEIQRQGKRPMSVAELLRGFHFKNGFVLK